MVLLLTPKTAALGAVLTLGIISGAIVSHLTKLGIEIEGDGGLLFWLAVTVFVCAGVVATLRREQIPILGPRLFGHGGERIADVQSR